MKHQVIIKSNAERVKELSARRRVPKFALGELVREPHGEVGAVDGIFADLEAAHDMSMTDADEWYAVQNKRPKTPKNGIWYAVIIPTGAVLAGEDDLVLAAS